MLASPLHKVPDLPFGSSGVQVSLSDDFLSGSKVLPIGKDHVFPGETRHPVPRVDEVVGRDRSMVDHYELNPLG
ncbi:MAG: hypothetical protein H6Q42_3328 [Deltaproteobacteria bacterium]|nr:hypothetical protein [Deltaproteobacteria bacterium]